MGYGENAKRPKRWDPADYHGFSVPGWSESTQPHGVKYIYFVRRGDLVKVGLAKNVEARIHELRLGAPDGLELCASYEVPYPLARQVERKIHRALHDHAVGREWFRTTPDHAQALGAPFIEVSRLALEKFFADGLWSGECEPPEAPPGAMLCGLAEPEIVAGTLWSEDEWLQALEAWAPAPPQAAAFVAVDLPAILTKMPAVTVSVSRIMAGTEELAWAVDVHTHGWSSAERIFFHALGAPAIKDLHMRWERGGLYAFEVPTYLIDKQRPKPTPPPVPDPKRDITVLLAERRAARKAEREALAAKSKNRRKPEARAPKTVAAAPVAPKPPAPATAPSRKMSKTLQRYLSARGLPT